MRITCPSLRQLLAGNPIGITIEAVRIVGLGGALAVPEVLRLLLRGEVAAIHVSGARPIARRIPPATASRLEALLVSSAPVPLRLLLRPLALLPLLDPGGPLVEQLLGKDGLFLSVEQLLTQLGHHGRIPW